MTRVDFLTVDVEGFELEVLSTIDLAIVDVDVIAVEVHGDFESVQESKVYDLLRRNTYEVIAWTPPTVFFRRKKCKDRLTLGAALAQRWRMAANR